MLAAAATVTGDVSGGTMTILETPMDGLTARWVISTFTEDSAGGAAVRLRILAANVEGSTYQTIACSPAINLIAFAGSVSASAGVDVVGVGADGLEILVRFGSDWDFIKYVIDTRVLGTGNTMVLRHEGVGLVEDAVKFPQWDQYLGCLPYFVDGGDAQA